MGLFCFFQVYMKLPKIVSKFNVNVQGAEESNDGNEIFIGKTDREEREVEIAQSHTIMGTISRSSIKFQEQPVSPNRNYSVLVYCY